MGFELFSDRPPPASLYHPGEHFCLTANLSHLMSDGDGLREAYNWKGASSLKPCLRHWNVFSRSADMSHRREGFTDITCCNPAAFKVWDRAELHAVVDLVAATGARVASGEMTRARADNLQKIHGISDSDGGILNDRFLRDKINFIEVATFDWVHSALQDGHRLNKHMSCGFQFAFVCRPILRPIRATDGLQHCV